MSAAIYPSLVFTVAMLVTNAYFLMGGLPLLVLQHDSSLDAKFIGGFFNLYYKAAMGTALGASLSYALWGRFGFALGAAGLLVFAVLLRRYLIPVLQRLGAQIEDRHADAIASFRKAHGVALALNLLQLVLVVWATTQLSL